MSQVYDLGLALTTDWKSFCVENRRSLFTVMCEEGPVEMTGARLLINLVLTMPLIRRHYPISRDKHLLLKGIYNAKGHAAVMTRVVETLESYGHVKAQLGHEVIMTVQEVYNLGYSHLGAFVQTGDIFSYADTILQKEAEPACTPDYGDIEDLNIKRMEDAFKVQSSAMYDLLAGDTLPYNAFRGPLKCNALKPGQFKQFVFSVGPRTDTDESMFKRPVVGSFLSGMRDILDYALESRSAAKATHYNKTKISDAQYLIRRLHIHTSPVWHLYKGDCGSTNYVTYGISQKTVKHFAGKFYLTGDMTLMELTPERYPDVIGKSVKMRSPITCKYTDGYCEVCGGTITHTFSDLGNVGFLANVKTGSPATQQVLSAKHHSETHAATYKIPDAFDEFLMVHQNDILIRPSLRYRAKNIALGFVPQNLAHLNDLQYYIPTDAGNAAHFSDVRYLIIGEVQPDGSIQVITTKESMVTEGGINPHLSPEVLTAIRKHPGDIEEQEKITWLHLRNVNVHEPIMQCTVVNDSITHYVKRFRSLISSQIERYTSANEFMHDFSHLVWDRVDSHATHLETLVKASLVTSQTDPRIPVVEDPDNVMFGTLGRLIPMRSIGALLSFQGFHTVVNKPLTYIVPKDTTIIDEFLGTSDIVERDKNYPIFPAKLEV